MSETIIEVRHLQKTFGNHTVLRDMDFTVREGDVTSIIGASGSGKSTLPVSYTHLSRSGLPCSRQSAA